MPIAGFSKIFWGTKNSKEGNGARKDISRTSLRWQSKRLVRGTSLGRIVTTGRRKEGIKAKRKEDTSKGLGAVLA